MKKLELLVATLACLIILIMPAMAAWNFDGWEVKTMETGSIKGDVFVSYGDKSGLSASPYTSNFNLPGGTEKYSRLYVGVWGATETKTGTLSTVFNGNNLGTININGTTDTNPTYTSGTNVYGRGNGVWWASYNVTGSVTMGAANSATATTGGTIDGRVYAIVLVTVYSDSSEPEIQYWINEGSLNLHYKAPSYPWEQDKTFVWFNGATITPVSAKLNAVYLTSSKGEPDYLYFNPPVASDSPYSNMAWDINAYRTYQLDGSDVADGSNGEYFDFESFTSTYDSTLLKNLISGNNYAVFWRGHDDNNDGTIYAEFTPTNPVEGESYVGPVLAALVLEKAGTLSVTSTPQSSLGSGLSAILNENGRPRHTGDNETEIAAQVTDSGMGITSVTVDLSAIGGSTATLMAGPYTGTGTYKVKTKATAGINGTHSFVVTVKDNGGNTATGSTNSLTIHRRGDVKRNNIVDMGDALYIARYTVGLETPNMDHFNFVGDLMPASDNDYTVNMGDALYIARHSVGLEPAP